MNVLKSYRTLSILSIFLGHTIKDIYGYSTGAPTRACGNMTPQHGYPINTSPAPYLVEISKTQYSANERIYVRLRACGQARFKGFMIQPRSAIFPNRAAFLGQFARVQGTRYECVRTGAVLTHSSPVDKQSVTLTWIAPPGAAGHVVFRVTFVQSFNSYWVSINSPVVYDGVSRDLTMVQAFALQSSTDQSCLPPRPTTRAPTTTTTSTTAATTTTTTEATTTTTTTMPTTTTTEFIPPAIFTTPTEPTTTTTEPSTTTTTTTEPSTTTTEIIPDPTTTSTSISTQDWLTGTDDTSTDYWPDYWDTTTVRVNESSTQKTMPTIFPTAPYTTTTTSEPSTTTTTTTEAMTTTTTTDPPPTIFKTTTTTTASTTTRPTTTTTPATTTTTTVMPTTTTTTAATTTTTMPPLPPSTTTTTSLPVTTETTVAFDPSTVPTTRFYPTMPYDPTTAYYPTIPVDPTIVPDVPTSNRAPAVPTVETVETTAIPVVTEPKYTTPEKSTPKQADATTITEKVSTESVPDITFPQFTDKAPVDRFTTTTEPQAETSTSKGGIDWPSTVPADTTSYGWDSTEPPVVIETDLELIPDQGCGKTQGCFDDCRNGVCNFIISWKPDRFSTRFEIRTRPSVAGPYWAAIGFSDDKKMGLDSVTECITEDNKVNVYQSYNLDYYRNLRLITPKLGITEEYGRMQNGIFSCTFTRENFVEGEKDVFDLNKNWFMMFAEGPAVNGIKIPHRYDVIPPTTDVRVNLQQYPPMYLKYDPAQAQPHQADHTEIVDSGVPLDEQKFINPDESCGAHQSCFQDCTPLGCRFIVSWISGPKDVIFKMRAVLNDTTNRWIALAFSHDNKMGEDNVVQCVSNDNGEISVSQSYNQGKNNIRIDDAQMGISNTSGSFVDGIFECAFVRQRYVEDSEQIFDLEKPWNILFASGRAKNGIMLPHSFKDLPHVSDDAIDFTKMEPTLLTANTLFIKIHAALMIFAWILCASIATVIGRYFQPYWWGEKMFGSKAWIQVHWLFVILTLLAVVASFSLIFVGVDGMSKLYQTPGASFNSAHPVMGLIVAVLVLLNPLLLLLRPSEESQTRAFFDCVYWLVEMGAHVLAVITIYAGFGLADYIVPAILAYCLIGFACYQVLVLLFMEGLKSYDAKKTVEKKKMYLYEMQIRPWNPRRNNSLTHYMDVSHSSKGLKRVILSFHFLVLTALTTVMILLLVISKPETANNQHGIAPAIH